ncbi:hypothetical protein QWY85_19500 [Neolewinella lacunae]|uniref:Uncharacterized protein n=1 Tax=Neolewinella lacunae TaxID=1517758 RepID=A0A923PLF2_9BACT|nr:hypothetical protein [Neolewinella lacunae]MBC6996242.1 hypothetical protein [Neolewinella lacunae]MDN3636865.1 hypothetical protein [Neolewinella lacunae]
MFNIFIANVNGPDNGFARGLGSTTLVNENFSAQLLIHELGHGLVLQHTFDGTPQNNDDCDDTPFISWTYDRNGDGSIDASGNRCWNLSNVDTSGINLCQPNGTTVVNSHPCCEQRYQNNNMMTYASYASDPNVSAFTPCQMGKMLDNLLNDKCDLIDEINPGCPPASAHIGLLPIVDFSEDCKFSFYFQASTNEVEYRVTYEVQQPNGSFTTFRQTDWIDGQAGQDRVAVGTKEHDKFANIVLLSNATYNVIIETRNLCGDTDLYARQFTTGNCDLRPADDGGTFNPLEDGSVVVYPNPSINGTTLSYTTNAEADIKIYLTTSSGNGNSVQTLLKQADSGNKEACTYSVYFPTHELGEGLNYISIHADDNIVVRRVQKNN